MSTERQRSRDHVTTMFPSNTCARERTPSLAYLVVTGGHVVTAHDERCSTCSMPLVHANGRLICPRPACPGHNANATSSVAQATIGT
jgi:uncharacterized Zn finger protein (UPF0148 family)